MGKLTKKMLKKHLERIHNKKSFKKAIQEQVVMAAIDKLGDAESDCIVIDDISIEIIPVESQSKASSRCIIYCYVINGRRICRKICY